MRTFVKRFLFSCLLLAGGWFASLCWFAAQIPTQSSPPENPADAIVVLTGGAGRIEMGVNLLLASKGKKLFVSGANQQVKYIDIVHLTPKENREFVRGLTGWKIILGSNAENTIGNAQETKEWLDKTDYTHILLVTSNYHMPRSLSEFSELMPDKIFIPIAVIPEDAKGLLWWLKPTYRQLVLSEYYKYLISKLRHWAIHNVFSDMT